MELNKQAEASGEEDRLSNLPEGIITHILSFLSTKESVRTSILSTQWKYIWSTVPTLNFRFREFIFKAHGYAHFPLTKARSDFFNFVDRMLMGHSLHFLDKVYIDGSYYPSYDGSRIESWIHAAIKRNVRQLKLVNLFDTKPHELHQRLFSCNKFVVLKFCLSVVLNFPMTSTCFPNLKLLKLEMVTYKDDASVQNLISSCPVLEDLVIVRGDSDILRTLKITSRPLKKLVLRYIAVNGDKPVQIIVIDAPALKSLDIEDNVTTHEYVVRDLSSVISAKLYVLGKCSVDPDNYGACLGEQFIKWSFNVKFLRLSCSTMLSLLHSNSYSLPTFHNLTYLKFYDDWKWKMVVEFLKNSPVLEVLIFEGFDFSLEQGSPSESHVVPNCFISHLKTIKIKGSIHGDGVEKVRYFLKNAKVLEKLMIKTYCCEAFKNLKINCADILKHPRVSFV